MGIVRDVIQIIIGALIFAIGINFFTVPNGLSEGGLIGITIVVHYLSGWSTGVINFVLNILFLIIGYQFIGKKAISYTLISIAASSYFLYLTEDIKVPVTNDTLLAVIFAGLLVGVGLGIIFRAGGTSGGTTILARMFNQYFGWSMGTSVLIIDIVVVISSSLIIGLEKAMYTLVVVYIGAKAINYIVEGLDEKLAVLIISNSHQQIMDKVLNQMSKGVTVLDGYGGYTKMDKEVLYIVISKIEIVELKAIVQDVDPEAYITSHSVNEIKHQL
ncbi:YitT family protein [Gracilibacillus sp. YIM 98692]|uniref:YitT family protein n=1 Tax=Gracilibacillus sp. YIM 98692 TaxID=2663532 RepID=UPI0013D4B05F|nr:YitT family protein [Gracilibacillus sp. YIM 98692]